MIPAMISEVARRQRGFLVTISLVFVVVALLTYLPVLGGKVPFPAQITTGFPPWEGFPTTVTAPPNRAEYGDIVTLFYPWHYLQSTTLSSGELPLWNPHILSGTPFLGNTQSALFYPLNVFFYLLPVPAAWAIKLIASLALAGIFTALFVRSIGGNEFGSIAAGIVFALSGLMTAWQGTTLTDGMMWLPLILWSVHQVCFMQTGGWALGVAAVAFAIPVLAGHPETALHVTAAGCAFALWQSIAASGSVAAIFRRLGMFTLVGLFAIGVSAIQLVPTLEWIGQLDHGLDLPWGTNQPYQSLAFFSRDLATNPNSSGLAIPESAVYAGLFTLLLAPLAFLNRRKRESVFFLLVFAVTVQIIYGFGPVHWLMQNTPVVRALKNYRVMAIADFSLGVLAGLGITALCDLLPKGKRARLYLWIAPLACLIATAAAVWALETFRQSDPHWLSGPLSSAVFLAVGYVLFLFRAADRLHPRTFGLAAVALMSVDLITFAYGYFPFASPAEMYPDAPLIQFLKERDQSPFRVTSLSSTYFSNVEMIHGLSATGGYDLPVARLTRFLDGIADPGHLGVSLSAATVAASQDRRLDLLNTRYFVTTTWNDSYDVLAMRPDRYSLVFSDASVRVFESRSALPRAIFVPAAQAEIIPDEEMQLARLKDSAFDPGRAVILPAMPAELASANEGTSNADTAISWARTTANDVELNVETPAPGILVLSQVFYPGWQVWVDGREAEILRPNYALTGVALQSGTHSVSFLYRPASFRIGSILTLASLALLIFVGIRYEEKPKTS